MKLSEVHFRKEYLNQIKEVLPLKSYSLPLINSAIKERVNEFYNSTSNSKKEKWLEN